MSASLSVPHVSTAARRHRMFLFGVACAALGLLIGAVSFLGWILGDEQLQGAFVAGITVKTNTAIGLAVLGLSLLILAPPHRPRIVTALGRGLAVIPAALGVLTLVQHFTGLDLGIDNLVFREAAGATSTSSPNRMGPPASTCFVLLGLAALWLDHPGRRDGRTPSQSAAVVALVVCLVPLLGYLLGVHELYGIARYTGIAFQTSVALAALALAAIALRPGEGFMAKVLAEGPGGVLMRRLLPASILLPIAITWLRVQGERTGFYADDFGRVLLVLLFIVLFAFLTFWTGSAVSRHDAAREIAVREREESLRESDRRKNVFLATLAHELRNPLAPVRNAVELLRLKGAGDPDQRWAHGMIERQVSHLARLIDDLMDVSRIAHGKLELQRARTSLGEVIATVVETGRSSAAENGHALEVVLPEEPLPLHADPVRLVQVFSNLLANAIKYTPPGGSISITAERAEGEVVVRVVDSGVGIPAEEQARLFEMFFQATDAVRTPGGLGIGLALVRHLVELHGGRVGATSAGTGKGSTFEVRLPLDASPEATPRSEAAGSDAPLQTGAWRVSSLLLASRRVLVVDDNKDAAVSLGAILTRAGAEVALAHDGDEALAVAQASEPDIVVLDLGLPGKDGYEVAATIRSRTGGPNAEGAPLIVALTGWGQETDRERSRAAGFDHHLVKPVAPEELLDLLASVGRPT